MNLKTNYLRFKTTKWYVLLQLVLFIIMVGSGIKLINLGLSHFPALNRFWVGFLLFGFVIVVIGAYVTLTSFPDLMEMVKKK